MNDDTLNGLKKWVLGSAVTLTVALVMQCGVLIWWASSLTTRVHYIERDVAKLGQRVDEVSRPGN